jgi:hypothetical protein
MADTDDPSRAHPRLDELLGLGQDARVSLVKTISAMGFEPGCWVCVHDGELISSVQARELMGAAIKRIEKLPRDTLAGIKEFEGEHSWDPPIDGEPAWVILSQSCDLVRDVRDEPLVQLALLRRADDVEDLVSWSRNSARWIPLDPTGKQSRYYVDLRAQAFVAKQIIADLDVRQAIPPDSFGKQRPRTRFAHRVGQRHSRMGIPTRTVIAAVDPLVEAVNADRAMRARLDETFSEWLLVPGDPPALVAVADAGPGSPEFQAAEDLFFEQFWRSLPDELAASLDENASQVVALDDLRVPMWMSAWKIDLDFLTYGAKGRSDSPEPQV